MSLAIFKNALRGPLARYRASDDDDMTEIWTCVSKVPLRAVEAAWNSLSPYQKAVGWSNLDEVSGAYGDVVRSALFWAVESEAPRVPSAKYKRKVERAPAGWPRTAALMPMDPQYQARVATQLEELRGRSAVKPKSKRR